MNQSWCAIRNSRTSWLSWCSDGESSWSGCDINPGRNITARSNLRGYEGAGEGGMECVLCAVIRFLSDLRAKTERRSRT